MLVLLQSFTNQTSAKPLRDHRQTAYFAAQSRELSNNFRERRVQNAVPLKSSSSAAASSLAVESVPVIPIPLPSQSAQHILDASSALTSHAQRFPDSAGVSDDELLNYFPADVLKSTAKFRPVKVRVIEHDDYIDYELAFVEEDEDEAAAQENGTGGVADTISHSSTERPVDAQITAPSFTAVTFVNLLERARRRHHELMAATTTAASLKQSTTTPMTPPAVKVVQSRGRVRNSRVPLRSNFFRIKHSYEQKAAFGGAITKHQRIPRREYRSSGTTQAQGGGEILAHYPVTPIVQPETSPLLAQTSTQRPQSNTFTNVQTVSEMVVTRNESSTRVMPNRENHVLSITTPSTITQPPPPDLLATLPSSLTMPEHDELINVLSTTDSESIFETTFTTPITTTATTITTTNSTKSPIKSTTIPAIAPLSTLTPATTENSLDQEVLESRPSIGAKHRIPRIIEPSKWEENAAAQVLSGQYHEIKPGQYHEVNPGQYHEVNPGQYHEDSPGQYHEHSPGQYHETNFGQYHEVNPGHYTHVPDDEVEVEVERVAGVPNRRVYNVQSKVDQFIIGEYGTINENSGQTLKGVRYTAVDDSTVDPKIIFDTLQKYFKFS